MANLSKIIYINEEDYSILVNGGTITKNGQTYSYDSGALYVIKDVSAPEYAETAGYAQSASRARYDYYGNSISDTYQQKPLIIEVEYGDTDVPSGTFDSIYQAIQDERDVIVKCDDGNEFYYLPLVYDSSRIDEYYYFQSTNYTTVFRIAIMNDDSISINLYTLSKDNEVVHKASVETISGNKTFTGSVSLGSNATATTPAASDNDTSVATTAFVKTAISGLAVDSNVVHKSGAETITGNKTFSGTVALGSSATATTQATTDNDTSVATTAFVHNVVNNISVDSITNPEIDVIWNEAFGNLITFTVGNTSFEAVEGMTWEQFIGSSYDPTNGAFHIVNNSAVFLSDYTLKYSNIIITENNISYSGNVDSQDPIFKNTQYNLQFAGGSND